MANKTNFTLLLDEQKKVWSREIWKTARNTSFVYRFAGKSMNSPIHQITELTKTERGDQAVITLVTDLEGDGVTGDNQLWDNEEPLKAYDQVIIIDQLRNANRTTGRMADQRTIVNFREQSRDKLGYWLGDRIDQMGFLTLSGVDYRMHNNGAIRAGFSHNGTVWARDTAVTPAGKALYDLAWASDVTAPTANRHRRWIGSSTKALAAGNTEAVAATDLPSYGMLVEAKAYAKDQYIRGIRTEGNEEYYIVFMHPLALAKLKLDQDFLANVRNAGPRGSSNVLFKGGIVTVDGLVIYEFRHVFNTSRALAGASAQAGRPGYKWGANADVNGTRTLMLGAQAMGIADLGMPTWEEDDWDYKNQLGIATGKILGMKKPVFRSIYTAGGGSDEDFGLLCIDHAF